MPVMSKLPVGVWVSILPTATGKIRASLPSWYRNSRACGKFSTKCRPMGLTATSGAGITAACTGTASHHPSASNDNRFNIPHLL